MCKVRLSIIKKVFKNLNTYLMVKHVQLTYTKGYGSTK